MYVFSSSWLTFYSIHFENRPEYRRRWSAQMFITFTRFLRENLVSRSFLSFCKVVFTYSLPFPTLLFDDVHFQYSQIFVIFLFFKRFDSFLIWKFYSFIFFYFFRIFHYLHDRFFFVNFHSIPIFRLYHLTFFVKITSSLSFSVNILISICIKGLAYWVHLCCLLGYWLILFSLSLSTLIFYPLFLNFAIIFLIYPVFFCFLLVTSVLGCLVFQYSTFQLE